MVKEGLKAAEKIAGVTTEFIALRGKKIGFCLHCDRCLRKEVLWCPAHEEDDMKELYPKIAEADGYILGSPVYQMNMSGQMLTFLNRWRPLWPLIKDGHLKTRVGGALVVGGTRHGGQENALEAINNFFMCFGMLPVTGGPWAYNGGAVWSQDKKEQGVRDDEVGLATVRALGRRVGEVASLIAAGKTIYKMSPTLQG
jgi:multimeric flavodoxin WrbA